MKKIRIAILSIALTAACATLSAQNPIIRDNFSADPSAHVFNGRMYVYPSHDIPAPADYNRKDWFCMADYHVYSSDNLVDWVDHGVIVDQKYVPWVNASGYSMWAPDCNVKDGKYYFVFPAPQKRTQGGGGGNAIGIAQANSPAGPFTVAAQPISGAGGIDPCLFIDDDGSAYLLWSGMGQSIAKLKDNMLEIDGRASQIGNLPSNGMKEGPYLFKRKGKYYFMFAWQDKERESIGYSMSDNVMGPYEFKGKIMDQHADVCWTNHGSVVEFKGQWYFFYHHNDYSPYFDKNRSVCVDYLNFNEDGTIIPVIPTKRGVGITAATDTIQIDRYSQIGEKNVKIDFINSDRPFDGWKTIFWNTDEYRGKMWVTYDRVDFGEKDLSNVVVKCLSKAGGMLEIRADSATGPVLANLPVKATTAWSEQVVPVQNQVKGVHTLYVGMTNGSHIEVDWVKFK